MAASSAATPGLVAYRLRAELRGHASDVRAVVALPGGGFATASRDATVCVWEPRADGGDLPAEPTRVLRGHDHFVVTLAVVEADGAGGRALLASGSADKTIRIWYALLALPLSLAWRKLSFQWVGRCRCQCFSRLCYRSWAAKSILRGTFLPDVRLCGSLTRSFPGQPSVRFCLLPSGFIAMSTE